MTFTNTKVGAISGVANIKKWTSFIPLTVAVCTPPHQPNHIRNIIKQYFYLVWMVNATHMYVCAPIIYGPSCLSSM